MRRVNKLAREPEFYDTLTNNCTTNIRNHINHLKPDEVPYDYRVLLPGYSDRAGLRPGPDRASRVVRGDAALRERELPGLSSSRRPRFLCGDPACSAANSGRSRGRDSWLFRFWVQECEKSGSRARIVAFRSAKVALLSRSERRHLHPEPEEPNFSISHRRAHGPLQGELNTLSPMGFMCFKGVQELAGCGRGLGLREILPKYPQVRWC